MQLGSANLTQKYFTMSSRKPFSFGIKKSRSRVTKTLLAWVFALLWVRTASGWWRSEGSWYRRREADTRKLRRASILRVAFSHLRLPACVATFLRGVALPVSSPPWVKDMTSSGFMRRTRYNSIIRSPGFNSCFVSVINYAWYAC